MSWGFLQHGDWIYKKGFTSPCILRDPGESCKVSSYDLALKMHSVISTIFYLSNKSLRLNKIRAEGDWWRVTRSHYIRACLLDEASKREQEESKFYHVHLWKIEFVTVFYLGTKIHILLTWKIQLLPKSHQSQIYMLLLMSSPRGE